jgi:hypothetical protein
VMIALMGILFFPCIVFGIAHTCCIRDQRKDGRQPVPQAWTICTSLFVTALLCTWFPVISILWLILPFCMVAPFCFDQCCKSCAHPPSAVDSIVSRLTPRTVSRVARRGHWRGYARIQSRGQATGTARSREARADPEG